jgi:hypothetical protein
VGGNVRDMLHNKFNNDLNISTDIKDMSIRSKNDTLSQRNIQINKINVNKKTSEDKLIQPDYMNSNSPQYGTVTNKQELMEILKLLNTGETTDRVNIILVIHEMIYIKFNKSKHILIPNIDLIINAFIIALRKLFENKNVEQIPIKLGKYLLTVLYKISSNKELITNISYDTLLDLSEEILSDLLIDNLDKVGDNQEGLIIIKSVNSTMLRVLENCNYTDVISILLELVEKYRQDEAKSKISGLAIKCLLKMNQALPQIIDVIQIEKIFLRIHELLINLELSNPDLVANNQTDQMIIRYIKNLISEIVKLKHDTVIENYVNSVEKHEITDKYLKKWIKNILSSISNESTIIEVILFNPDTTS